MNQVPIGYLLGTSIDAIPIPIFEGSLASLGRDLQNTIPLDDLGASRRHAFIEGREGKMLISDLNSSNGTFIDDNRIKPHEKKTLFNGNEIRIGGKLFYVISATSATETQKIALSCAGAFSRKPTLGDGFNIKAEKEFLQKKEPDEKNPKFQNGFAAVGDSARKTQRFTDSATPQLKPETAIPEKQNLAPPSLSHSLSGKIGRGGFAQIIQMIHSKCYSGSMLVTGEKLAATILFLNGELYSCSSAGEEGVSVIYKCALEKHSEFSFNRVDSQKVERAPKNISECTMYILMQCCNLIFEASTQA